MFVYSGPNRTVTEPVIVCKIVLWECQYVPAKGDWRYHQVRDWSCSNESKPWLDKPSQPSGCFPPNSANPAPPDQYWTREESVQNISVTYPPAEISAQPLCGLAGQNGWCRGGAGLQLTGYEPVAGEHITGIEWTLNGETFAVQNSASVTIPALEGQSNFQYWAHSSFPDTSLLGTSTLYLDSQPPQVTTSSLAGTPGENGWYVSDVNISVSFADPSPGSGLDALTYILSGGAAQPFASPLTLTDGEHEVLIRAFDLAGNLSELSQTVKVDTIPPQLEDNLAGTLFDGWYAKTAILSASASDAGSGLAGLDVSLDGGAWTPYESPLTIGDGLHQAVFRARDVAGNLTVSAPLPFKVDARGPRIDLPENWNIWDIAAFAVRDGESGLAQVEVILSDPQGRWPQVTRTYTPTGSRYDGQIGWNRRFADGTLAPEGQYRVTVKASDLAGNFSQKQATLVIPPAGDTPGEETIIQPVVEAEEPPLETTFALPPEEPQPIFEPVETVFGGTSLAALNEAWQANSLAAAPPLAEPSGILWGAGALAAMAAMTAYYEQKRREEEEAQRAAVHAQFAAEQAEKERQQKAQAKVMAKLEKQWAEEKFKEQAFEAWKAEQEQAKAVDALSAADSGKKVLASPAPNISMPQGLPPEAQQAFLHGGSAAQAWINNNAAQLQAEHQAKLEKQRRDDQAKNTAASYSSQAAAWLGIDKYIYKPEAPKETAAQEKPWWETAGEWWQDNVVSPVQETIQKTVVEPAQQAWNALTTPASVWLGESPNYDGIKIAERIVPNEGTITIMGGYGPVVVENFLVRPGISVQAQWYNKMIDSRDGWSKNGGLGYAQVSDEQVKGEILDAEEKYTGNLGLGPNFDQTTDKGAYIAMATRIGIALEACARYCNLTNSQEYDVWVNRLLFSALSQNGSGYSPRYFNARQLPKVNSDIDWVEFLKDVNAPSAPDARIRELLTGKKYEPDLMVKMYVRDLQQMHTNGMPVPEEYLKALERVLEKLEEAKNNRSETNE
jgi:hypothetical protein